MANSPPESFVEDDVDGKVTWASKHQSEALTFSRDAKMFSHFRQVLQDSTKVDRQNAYKIVKMIKGQNGLDGLQNMSEVSFLEKAKFILKHNIHNKAPLCSFCLNTFKNTKDNDHVMMIHENSVERKLSCQICEKSFMSRTALKYHVDVSHSVAGSKVKCKLCDVTFQHALSLKRHVKSMHRDNPEIYQCEDCQKKYLKGMTILQ
jgi:hypothetical protein